MPNLPRIRIAPGIYEDARGRSACVTVGAAGPGRRTKERRFPLGTPIETIQKWQDAIRRSLALPPPMVGGGRTRSSTLADWASTYLASVTAMPSFEARRADLEAWLPAFGQRSPFAIEAYELATQIDLWKAAGYAASTLNHRRQALRAVYQMLAPDAPSPIDRTERQTPPPLEARAMPWADVLEIVAALPATKAGTLLTVLAWTGLPPARICRLTPGDLDVDARTLFLSGRRKGQGTASKTIRLVSEAVAALTVWFAHFPTGGRVERSSWMFAWKGTIARVNAARADDERPPLPTDLRPYDLRHSFGTEVYRRTNDLQAAAALLDVSLETAQRYTLGAVSTQVDKAVAAMEQPGRAPAAVVALRPRRRSE